jgi:hypothetical protein
MKRIVLNSIAVFIGLLVGIGSGAYVTFARYNRDYRVVRAFSWARIGFGVSENEFGSQTSGAREALMNTLYLFEQDSESPKVDPEMRKAMRMDCGRFEAQLSVLEREGGNADQARLYMSKAQADLKAVGWTDYSEDKILRTFPRQPSPCANSSNNAAQKTTTQKPCG